METVKRIFSPGKDQDDEVMYGSGQTGDAQDSSTTSNTGTGITALGEKSAEQSEAPQQQTSETVRSLPGTTISRLRQEDDDASTMSIKSGMQGPYAGGADTPPIDRTGQDPALEQTSSTEYSNTGRNAALGAGTAGVAGLGAAAYEGSRPEDNNQDDVADATYTSRSHYLGSGKPDSNRPAVVEKDPGAMSQTEQESNTARDTSLAGAGTIIGAGALGGTAYEAQDKPKDQEVEDATYTERSYGVGAPTTSSGAQEGVIPMDASHQDVEDPNKLDSSNRTAPHVPGEFPTESGNDPHVPGEFPSESGEREDRGIGSGAATSTAMSAGVLGAGAGTAGLASSQSGDPSTTTESTGHLGGKGFPVESSTGPTEPTSGATQESESTAPTSGTTEESEHNYGRDAAIAGGAAAATGAAGYGIYEGTKSDDTTDTKDTSTTEKPAEKKSFTDKLKEKMSSKKSSDSESKDTKGTESTKPEEEEEDHTGRNTAIAGGAAAATGAAGYGAYEYANRDDEEAKKEAERREAEKQNAEEESKKREAERQKQAEKDEAERQKKAEKEEAERKKKAEKEEAERKKKAEKEEAERKKEAEKREKEEKKEAEKREKEEKKAAEKRESEAKEAEKKEAERREAERKQEEGLDEERKRKEEEEEDHTGRDAAVAGGAAAATGAAGYGAYEYAKGDETQQEPTQQEPEKKSTMEKLKEKLSGKSKDEDKSSESSSQQTTTKKADDVKRAETKVPSEQAEHDRQKAAEQEEDHTGRDAAIAGGGAAAAGAAGYGAYEATKGDETGEQHDDQGRQGSVSKKADEVPRDEMHKPFSQEEHDRRKAEGTFDGRAALVAATESGALSWGTAYGVDSPHEIPSHHKKSSEHEGEKKPGLLSKILHPGKRRSSQQDGHSGQHYGTDGQIGDTSRDASGAEGSQTGMTTSSDPSKDPVGPGSRQGSAPPPTNDEGYITLTHEGADPNAPNVIVRDHPSGT